MADQHHTPGPLRYRPDLSDDWGFIRDQGNRLIAIAKATPYPSAAQIGQARRHGVDPAEPNGRRIVAAWNAVEAAGLSTEALESGIVADAFLLLADAVELIDPTFKGGTAAIQSIKAHLARVRLTREDQRGKP